MSFDIHILPVSKKDGKDASEQVGIYLASPTGKTIRTRKADVVLFYLTMSNPKNFPQNKQILLFKKLADYYYQQKESVSSSLTSMIEYVNRYFLNQNIQNEAVANFFTGNITIAVFKDEKLYVAQVGKAIGFVCQGEGFSQQHAVTESVNLLGMKQGIEPFFYINDIYENSNFILAHEISNGWDKNSFRDLGNQSLHVAQQRLAPDDADSANFIIIKPSEGKGFIQLIQGKKREPVAEAMVKQKTSAPFDALSDTAPIPITTTELKSENLSVVMDEGERIVENEGIEDDPSVNVEEKQYVAEYSKDEKQKGPRKSFSEFMRGGLLGIKSIFDAIYNGYQAVTTPIRTFLQRYQREEPLISLSAPWRIGITIGVPILLSIAGLFVAMSTGSELVFQQKLAEANNQYIIAENTSELVAKKEAYLKALVLFDDALQFSDNDIEDLTSDYSVAANKRNSIQLTLDELNHVRRIDFYPLMETVLGNDVNITKIVNTDNDIFLLDDNSGEVLRIVHLQEKNYQVDESFKCSNKEYSETSMNPIVDIAEYPGNSTAEPAIVAIDNKGLILYCYVAGQSPRAEKVDKPPLGFGNTTEVDVKNNNIYILDKAANAVWFYSLAELRKSQDDNPDLSPTFYFGETMPGLTEVVDLTVNEDNLFAFYPNQHVALCTYQFDYMSGEFRTTTICEDPALFEDSRNEVTNTPFIQGVVFNQLTSTPAPEPSVFFADFSTQQIFQFSQKLKLIQVFEPVSDFSKSAATAFDVSPGYKPYRTILFAFGNELYYAKVE